MAKRFKELPRKVQRRILHQKFNKDENCIEFVAISVAYDQVRWADYDWLVFLAQDRPGIINRLRKAQREVRRTRFSDDFLRGKIILLPREFYKLHEPELDSLRDNSDYWQKRKDLENRIADFLLAWKGQLDLGKRSSLKAERPATTEVPFACPGSQPTGQPVAHKRRRKPTQEELKIAGQMSLNDFAS